MQTEQLSDFVALWECIQGVHLSEENDSISWRWTPSGSYTTASAYRIQFAGSLPHFESRKIWKVWRHIQTWSLPSPSTTDINAHWECLIHGLPKKETRTLSERLITSWWGIWKELNRRIFRSSALPPLEVAYLVWEEVQSRSLASSIDPGDI
ncbi:hypothetical protein BRADI_2g38731v3 [Brachypodium distachyon]|uniref:Reverse transcriptase zinc-binding domain-containing protein n=1 Tax=Brachypodium distachyon TaxID=15368 RepID=A0A0Q3GBR8_BRADI|nr:hypothetical protein BRADI_2g38731v3 [Brachypodium distachyon]